MPFMSANAYFGLAAEAVYGTAASVTTFTPMDNSSKVTAKVTWLNDADFRGSPVGSYDQVPGVRSDEFAGKSYLYNDVFPQLVRAALGSSDTVASVGPSTWTHTIGLQNQANTGSQMPSYTVWADTVDATYQLTASRLSDLSLTFASNAAVESSFTFMGNIYSVVASVAANESTQHLIPAWNCAASIAGASVAVIESGSLDIKRNTAPIYTLGQQGPYNNFAGPIDVSGKFVFIVEAGEQFQANALTRDEQQLILQFTDPVTSNSITFTSSATQLENPQIDLSKNYVTLAFDAYMVGNLTDTVTTGYSPIKCVVKNNVSTAY